MRKDNRKEKSIKKKRHKKRYLLKLAILAALLVALHFAVHIDYFVIDGVAVGGNSEITDGEILKLSQIKTGVNIFDVHPWAAEHRIKENLYIEEANVRRILPDKIEITVKERTGKVQLKDKKGRFIVLDSEGMVIDIAGEEQKATYLEGIDVVSAEKGKTVEVKQEKHYEKGVALAGAAEEGDLYFKKIKMDGDRTDAYIYDRLICRGKYENIMDSIESGTLKTVVFDLYQKGRERGVINIGSNDYCSFTPQK